MVYFLIFIIGSALGSFLNVLIDRLSTGRSFVSGRSYCESCKKTLQPLDLVPVLSFVVLRGRCRYCKASIPPRLFLVEVLSGSVLVFLTYLVLVGNLPVIASLPLSLVLLCFVGIFFADLQYGIIPDLFVLISAIGAGLFVISIGGPIFNHILSALGACGFFFTLYFFTKGRGMGFGDVKLAFVLGLLLGYPLIIVGLYLAFLTGAVVSIILVVWRKIRFFGGTIPFGPFMVFSTVLAFFYGQDILAFFISRFF